VIHRMTPARLDTLSRHHGPAATELANEVRRMWDLFERLSACVGRLDFDSAESALPPDEESWVEFVRTVHERAEKIMDEYDGADYAEYQARRAEVMERYTPRLKELDVRNPAYAVLWNERREALDALDVSYRRKRGH